MPQQSNLLWFHAFRHDDNDIPRVLDILRNGLRPGRNPNSRTRQNETILGITPPQVYLYLGRTLESFGGSAIALEFSGFQGTISPFDTGGLVGNIIPIRDWGNDNKQAYLAQYSWLSEGIEDLLGQYPGNNPIALKQYLRSEIPRFAGPHEVWPSDLEANIWNGSENTDWRAWIWEGRTLSCNQFQRSLHAWSCPAHTYDAIIEFALSDTSNEDWYEFLIGKYIQGGTRELVSTLVEWQVDNV